MTAFLAHLPTWVPFVVASLISNACIMAVEFTNRAAPLTARWIDVLPTTIIPIALAQYCLFRAFHPSGGAAHWFIAWAVFAVGNSVMRVGVVATFGEGVGSWPTVLFGIVGMMACALIVKSGL